MFTTTMFFMGLAVCIFAGLSCYAMTKSPKPTWLAQAAPTGGVHVNTENGVSL